jgi:predicted O-methyltransferase YrrM
MRVSKYSLIDFGNKLRYSQDDYKKFEDKILQLCAFTKCRLDPNFNPGYESCYLFLALQQHFGFKRFLEFGTGRGTTSFLMASLPCIKHVTTIDILAYEQARHTWCDYKSCLMSNKDIHEKCEEYLGTPTASILHICDDSKNLKSHRIPGGPFDLVYIDGSHDYGPVKYDFAIAKELLADDALVVFDDYDPKYGVYHAINELMADEDCILVSVNGHLYGTDKESENCGHIIWAKGKYKEMLNE